MATVLVADDDQDLLEMYLLWLGERADWSIRSATTGEEAVSLIDDGVDAAVLDRRMPGRSGDDVAQEIRDSHPACAVVLVSAFQPDDGATPDCDRYITKPIRRGDLIEAVEAEASL